MSKEFKLVPARILLDKNVIGAINFHCGDGDSQFGDYVDGELWVGALTDDDGKEVYGLHLLTSEYPEEGSTTLAEFAAPQPPALGGEPEVLAWVHPHRGLDWRVERMRVAPKTELIDRAHLAPLQADLKSAIADKEAYGQNAIDLRKKVDQLKARCDELEALLPRYQRGSNSLSGEVERLTLIAREAAISSAHRYSYMPALPEDAQNWKPHEWVLEAMRRVELDALSKPAGSEKV